MPRGAVAAMKPGGARATASVPRFADRVLRDPLAVPAGVGSWLRDWETRICAAWTAIDAACASESPADHGLLPAFDEALDEVRELLFDEESSAFHLLLARPLWQLTEGSAARETFDRYAETVLERSQTAIDLAHAVRLVRAEQRILIVEYEEHFPNYLGERLRRERVRTEDMARLRRPQDAMRLQHRLSRARAQLERLAAMLEPADLDLTSGTLEADERLTLAELRVSLAAALRARRQLERLSGALKEHRVQLSTQLRDLALTAPDAVRRTGGNRRSGYASSVLEQLLAMARPGEGDAAIDGHDAPHWTGAIAAALVSHYPDRGRFIWLPGLVDQRAATPPVDATNADADPTILRAVPLADDLVFLSPSVSSAIRVWSSTVRLGERVQCQVAPDDVARHPAALVERDVGLVFDGLDLRESGWYSTESRAHLRVVAHSGNGWFARIERRGTVKITDQPVWQSEGQRSDFRLLRPVSIAPVDTSARPMTPVFRISEHVRGSFLGFTIRDVRTGLRGDERAWSRGLTSRWAGGAQATRNEWRLYTALLRHQSREATWGSDLALRPLCWATLGEVKAPTPLYRIPFATLDAPGRLRSWIVERESNLVGILRAVARILEAAHATGHAVGAFHAEAFASAITWSPDPLAPTPTVVLAHAPCSAPFDEAYNAPPLGSDVLPAHYTMLRTPVLIPAVSLGQRATAATDLTAFAAFVLDLLLEQPLIDRDTIHWFDAGKIAHARAVVCAPKHPELVRWLVAAIEDPAGERRLGDLVRQLSGAGVVHLAQLRLAR